MVNNLYYVKFNKHNHWSYSQWIHNVGHLFLTHLNISLSDIVEKYNAVRVRGGWWFENEEDANNCSDFLNKLLKSERW